MGEKYNEKDGMDWLNDDEILWMLAYLMRKKAGEIADEMRTGRVSAKNADIVKDLCQMIVNRERDG